MSFKQAAGKPPGRVAAAVGGALVGLAWWGHGALLSPGIAAGYRLERSAEDADSGGVQSDWITLALGVLPAAPADLVVSRAEGGDVRVRLCGHRDGGLLVEMDAADADATSGVTFALDRPGGAAFAVFGTISANKPLGDGRCQVMIEVDEVVRWKHRRRLELDLLATVALSEPAATPDGGPTPVRLLNLSAEGIAFAVRGCYRRGDRLRLNTQIADRPITIVARVVQVGRPVFGQSRVSCTFPYRDDIAEAIQQQLGERAPAA